MQRHTSGLQESLSSAISSALTEAEKTGFTTIEHSYESLDIDLFEASINAIGRPIRGRGTVPGVDVLTPIESKNAPPRSLSRVHGVGSFPFHTDGAHWHQPPRWLVLACQQETEGRATRLLPAQAILTAYGEAFRPNEALFLVVNGHDSFYAGLVLNGHGKIRYDGGCMRPVNSSAKVFVKQFTQIASSLTPTEILWRPGLIAVIDNHRFLHARAARNSEGERTLYRALLPKRGDDHAGV